MAEKSCDITADQPLTARTAGDDTNVVSALPCQQGLRLAQSITTSFARRCWYRLTHWETWDWRIKYLLIAPAWLWFCVRARSAWFFTASNPTLTFGGFDGESKKEMYDHLPPGTYPESIWVHPRSRLQDVEKILGDRKMNFPLAVKPDVGKMGLMFRRINSRDELASYHSTIHSEYIVQRYLDYPLELSVFYYRMPDALKGVITGFIRKDFLDVEGNGTSTLWELILNSPRVQFRRDEMKAKHRDHLNRVLLAGERYCLSPALNLSRGGRLISLEHAKDERLLKVFDELSHHSGCFYYGRYDIKCESIEHLKLGRFVILEYNGSGAEPHHVYGNGYTLWQACAILVKHWAVLCRISRLNHIKGIRYWDFVRGWKFLQQAGIHIERLRSLDRELPVT